MKSISKSVEQPTIHQECICMESSLSTEQYNTKCKNIVNIFLQDDRAYYHSQFVMQAFKEFDLLTSIRVA